MAEDQIVDPKVNPQAMRPGNVLPERTPGSAPSVVPLPDGADPRAGAGEHPLPEDAIAGYPKVAKAAAAGDEQEYARAAGATPAPVEVEARPAETQPAPRTKTTGSASPRSTS